MVSVEAWATIPYLKRQVLGTPRIATEVGVVRNTVRRALCSQGPPKISEATASQSETGTLRNVVRRMLVNAHFIGSYIIKEPAP